MRSAFYITLAAGIILFGGLIGVSVPGPEEAQPDTIVRAGKKVWQKYGCVECHCLFGNGGYNAPDLTHVTGLRGPAWVNRFLARGPVMRPGKKKRHLKLVNAKERQQVIAYLAFVDRVRILGWPPEPQTLKPKRKL